MNQNQTTQIPETLQGQYAGFISRFIALTVDILVIILTVAIVGGIVTLFLRFFGLEDLVETIENSVSIQGSIIRLITAFWGVTFIAFLYFVVTWSVTSGKTIGKGLMGLRIVPMSGERITLLRSTLRYIFFWVGVMALGLGVFWILISDNRQGWHDKIAKTCVIYDWPAREDEGTVQGLQRRWHHLKHTRHRLRDRHKKDQQELPSSS